MYPAAQTASPIGGFGKIPTQGDFLRWNGASAAAQAFASWLPEAMEPFWRANEALPAEPISFLFRAAGAPEVLVGAAVPSRDAVGRVFPLAIFVTVDGGVMAERFPLVPLTYGRFLDGARALLAEAALGQLSGQELASRSQLLPLPVAEDVAGAETVQRFALSEVSIGEVGMRLFGTPEEGRRYYAFRTFLAACEPLRGQPTDRPGTTLDCPCRVEVDRFVWLELARRLLHWRGAPPSFMWTLGNAAEGGSDARLLLSLGPTPPSQLMYLARPDHGGAKLWPLLTARPDAVAQAAGTLRPEHRYAIDSATQPLEVLLGALAGGRF